MELTTAVQTLSALAHETRLSAFRLLVEAGEHGLPAGEIARTVDVPANTLSTHLGQLQQAGLIVSERRSRFVIYRIVPNGVSELLGFLLEDCCNGRPDLCRPALNRLVVVPNREIKGDTTMSAEPKNVLFLCTANSARSILAEAIMRKQGVGRFNAFSAGSMPRGTVHPFALELLEGMGQDIGWARSKSWDEFAVDGGPRMDFVFTVCDNAANEVCPIWPGRPMTAHWGIPDPVAAEGTEAEQHLAFADAYRMLERRISIFMNLPMATLDRMTLQDKLSDIGKEA